MRRHLTVAAVLVGIVIAVGLTAVQAPTAESGASLGYVRLNEAYEDGCTRFALEVSDWTRFSIEGLAHSQGPLAGARKVSGDTNGISVLEAIAGALRDYHKIGDVKPIFVLSPGGDELLIILKRFYAGTVCLVTLRCNEKAGWYVAAVEER